MADAQSKLQICKWIVKGSGTIYIPVRNVQEGGSNRIGQHNRPHRPGARLDGMGPNAKTWTLQSEVFDSDTHVAPLANKKIYPDLANDICDSFDRSDTGTLVTPTRGSRRCKAESYQRTDGEADDRNVAVLRLVFIEDNEDDDATAAYASLGVYASIQPVTFAAVAELEKLGAYNKDVAGLSAAADGIANLLAAPEQYVSEAEALAQTYMAQVARVQKAFTTSRDLVTNELRALLTGAEGSRALALLAIARDQAAGLVLELSGGGSQVVPLQFDSWVTLNEVAAKVGQSPEALAKLNPHITDANYIPAGTAVHVQDQGLPDELESGR